MMNHDHGDEINTHDDIATISCDGIINNDKTRALEKVWETLSKNGKYNVILDISQVNNIYSCGLGLLVKMHKDAQTNKGMLILTGVQGYPWLFFTSTKLSKLLFMAADKKAAFHLFDIQRKKQEEAQKETLKMMLQIPNRFPLRHPENGYSAGNSLKIIIPGILPTVKNVLRRFHLPKNSAGLKKGS
jgi:anti-anti-sigma factor